MRKGSTLYRSVTSIMLALVLVATGASAATAATRKHRTTPHRTTPRTPRGTVGLGLQGGSAQRLTQMCGADRDATVAPLGSSVSAHVTQALSTTRTTVHRTRKRTTRRTVRVRATGRAALAVEICHNGHWQRSAGTPLGSGASSSAPLDTAVAATGDYRVTASSSLSGRSFASAPVYLRVGVGEIVDDAVSFTIANTNRTSVALCTADGSDQVIRGHIVGPRALLEGPAPKPVTLYVHGIGYDQSFFHFKAVPGYDFATQMALDGKASIVIDRLGIGVSGQPDGNSMCIGSQVDNVHQVIQAIRGGAYGIGYGIAPQFQHIVLAGHSLGGLIAEYEAWTFHDIDGLIVMDYADLGPSQLTLSQFGAATLGCYTSGGMPNRSGAPHYEDLGATDADFTAAHFYNIDPAVSQVLLAQRSREPCGDFATVVGAILQDSTSLPFKVPGPVLLVFGQNDALFPPPAGALAKTTFGGTPDIQLAEIPQTGHAVALGRTAPQVRSTVLNWLNGHQF